MRILVITDEIYPDGIGGVGKSLFNECLALVQHGHQVTVLVRALDANLPHESVVNGIHLNRFFGPQPHKWYYQFYPLSIFYHVTRWLSPKNVAQFDILYLHTPIYMIPVWLRGGHRRIPVVFTFHGPLAEYIEILIERGKYGRSTVFAVLAAKVLKWIECWAFAQADAVLPRSLYTTEILKNLSPKAHTPDPDNPIPLGVSLETYSPQTQSEIRKAINLPEDRPILITVRRLDGRMGLINLIQAVAQIRNHYPDILQLIAGKGYLRPALENLITELKLQDNVQLLGFVSEEDLPKFLAAADLFVLPTESLEGFGLATIEALAAGLPVIGTPIGATGEILNRIDPKLLTDDASADSLAKTIQYWLTYRNKLPELRIRSRNIAEIYYDADKVASSLENVFQHCIDKRQHLS